MEEDEVAPIIEIGSRLPETRELHGLMMLVGNALAQPLAELRARQATLEAVRARARHPERRELHRAREEEAKAAATAAAVIEAEIDRLKAPQPRLREGLAGVYGYVRDKGRAVEGAEVALVDREEVLASIQSDKEGGFALSAASDRPLALRISVKRAVVHRDEEALLAAGPVALYRIVDLARAQPPRPRQTTPLKRITDDRPAGGEGEARPVDPAAVSDLPGETLNQALARLAEKDIAVAAIRVRPGAEATPKVAGVSTGETPGAITLEVQARETEAGTLAVLAALMAHDDHAEAAGTGSVAAAREALRGGGVDTAEKARAAAKLSAAEIGRRFGIEAPAARALKRALTGALAKIDAGG